MLGTSPISNDSQRPATSRHWRWCYRHGTVTGAGTTVPPLVRLLALDLLQVPELALALLAPRLTPVPWRHLLCSSAQLGLSGHVHQ